MMRFALVCSPLLLAATTWALPAFDAETGKFSTDGAAFAISFDNLGSVQGLGLSGYDVFNDAPVDELAVGARIENDPEGSIEGDGALGMGGDYLIIQLPMYGHDELIGRRVEISLWQKAKGTRMNPSLSWYGGDFTTEAVVLGTLTLQPTGEITSDGWERFSSGPVDWAWAEAVGPSTLDFYDEAYQAFQGAYPDAASRAMVDALTVVDLGPALVAANECSLPTEAADCGDAGLCHLGRCVDAAIRVGQAVQGDELRADYIDRRLFEVRTFEGGRAPRGKVDLVEAALEPLKSAAPNAATFWPTLSDAYTLLTDGHASAPLLNYGTFQNAGVCVHEGVADLLELPGQSSPVVVPLVFQAGASIVGAQLEPGDALVAIDGLPTAEWAALPEARRLIEHGGDPEARSVVTAPAIFTAAIDTGAVVTFQRCDGGADGITPCTGADVEEIVIDLGAIVGDAVLAGQTALSYNDVVSCDYRFVRPVDGTENLPNTDGDFAGFVDGDDGVRTLVINAVPGYSQRTDAWYTNVENALADGPATLIFDQRTGFGGQIEAVDWITGALLDAQDVFAFDFLSSFEGDDLDAEKFADAREAAIEGCDVNQSFSGCGNNNRFFTGSIFQQAQASHYEQAKDTKLAILLGLDVSGNDYTSRLLQQRSGETRFFGAGSAFGAYGAIMPMAVHMGELAGGSLQFQDTIFMSSSSDDNVLFATSTGVRPDEVVRQKQSDAIAGRDSLIEAAHAWLLQE